MYIFQRDHPEEGQKNGINVRSLCTSRGEEEGDAIEKYSGDLFVGLKWADGNIIATLQ